MKDIKINVDSGEWAGQWALVTGASSGIGREFAIQLAAKGINLVLLARRATLLETLASELTRQHRVATLVMVADLADPATPERVRCRLEASGIRVRLLVNNAAFGRWGRFEAQNGRVYRDMLQVNAIAPVRLCQELLTQLKSFPDAAIINLSSQAGFQPVPFMAVYAASKAFIHQFSQALNGEWGQHRILVQTLLPGPTATAFDEIAGAYADVIDGRGRAQDVVGCSLRGLAKGWPVVCTAKGTLKQRLFALMPARLVIRTVARMFRPPQS